MITPSSHSTPIQTNIEKLNHVAKALTNPCR